MFNIIIISLYIFIIPGCNNVSTLKLGRLYNVDCLIAHIKNTYVLFMLTYFVEYYTINKLK